MGVKVKWNVKKSDLDRMAKNAQKVNGTSVEVGAFEGEHAWLMGIHEYGLSIAVTDKMRGWLGANGLHLNPKTTHIHIPERSVLRAGYDKHGEIVARHAALILADVVTGRTTPESLYKSVGEDLSSRIKEYGVDLGSPGKHPFTLAQGAPSNPLVDSGDMLEGITWRVGE